jgi:divalent metal cation (Fe/Co/Zn/Cd) transporter
VIGEPARESVRRSLPQIAAQQFGVERAFNLVTVHLAPDQIVVALELEFEDRLTANEIEETVLTLERRIRKAHPSVISVFVKPKAAARKPDFRPVQRTA